MEFNVYYCENCNKTSQNIDDFFRQYCSQAIDFSRDIFLKRIGTMKNSTNHIFAHIVEII